MTDHNLIEQFTHAGRTVKIYSDIDPPNPREWDNLCWMVCWHRRAVLGDNTIAHMTEEEVRESVSGGEIVALLPLYLYQHSGMTMNTTGFSCGFDSGQVGWAYITKESAVKMGCVGAFHNPQTGERGQWDTARYEEAIKGEVSTYDDYLTGRCYAYTIEGADGDVLEGCGGIYGELSYVRQEARGSAEGSEDPAVALAVLEMQGRATFAGAGT